MEYIHHIYMEALKYPQNRFYFVLPPNFKIECTKLHWPISNHIYIILAGADEIPARKTNILRKAYLNSRHLAQHINNNKITDVILISLIEYLPFLPFFVHRNIKVRGIVYRIYLYDWKEESYAKRLQDILKYIIISHCDVFEKVFILNDFFSSHYLNKLYNTNKYSYLPDPIASLPSSSTNITRETLNIPTNKKVFLHPGGMLERKGTLEIMKALDGLPLEYCENIVLIFAGRVTDEIKDRFESYYNKIKDHVQIIRIEGYLSFELLADLFAICDYVLIPYQTHGQSSGIIGHAAFYKKPVVIGKKGLAGKLVRRWKLGFTLDDVSSKSIRNFLKELPERNYKSGEYVKTHTINSFCKILLS